MRSDLQTLYQAWVQIHRLALAKEEELGIAWYRRYQHRAAAPSSELIGSAVELRKLADALALAVLKLSILSTRNVLPHSPLALGLSGVSDARP